MNDFELHEWDKSLLMKYHGREETVHIPEGITRITRGAFDNNKEIVRVLLPSSLKTIESYAFDNCSNLTDVLAQEALLKIKNKAFNRCVNLVNVTIPKTSKVYRYAFDGCSKLKQDITEARIKEFQENEYIKVWLREHYMDKLQRIFDLCIYSEDEEKQLKAHQFLLASMTEDRQCAALYVIIAALLAYHHDPAPDYFPLDKACTVFAQFDLEEDCAELAEDGLEEELQDEPEIDDLLQIIKDYLFGF